MAKTTPNPSNERHQVLSFVTPLLDILFWEKADAKLQRVLDTEIGDNHYDTTRFPNHEVVHIRPLDTGGQFFQIYYAATRATQDLYNYEIKEGKILERTYIIKRSDYRQKPVGFTPAISANEFFYPVAATLDTVFTAYGFVGDTMVRTDEIMDSLYVVIQRRFIQPTIYEYAYNETLRKTIQIKKEVVAPAGAAPSITTPVIGTTIEIQKGNLFHDVKVTQTIMLAGSSYPYQLDVLPGLYNRSFPPRLESVDLIWAWSSASDQDHKPSYSEQYYFQYKLNDARPGPYASTVTEYITNDPAGVATSYPVTIIPNPVNETIGIATAYSSAGEFGNETSATAREDNVPFSLHEEITVNVGGLSSPLSNAFYTQTLIPTPGVTAFFALSTIIVEHSVTPVALGLYKVSVVRVDISNLYGTLTGVYAALATPTGLAVTSDTDTTIVLNWNDVTSATSYEIYQSLTGKNFIKVGESTSSGFTVTGLTQDTLYYFRVRAFNATSSSPNSSVISETTDVSI